MKVAGITGGSGSGKSCVAEAVRAALGETNVLTLSQDDYYRDLSHLPISERAKRNFDSPEAVELSLLAEHLAALRRGEEVLVPAYDMKTHARAGATRRAPRDLVLVEGTLIATDVALRATLDLLVFMDLGEDARFARRLARDTAERGRTPESVRRQWEDSVLPMHCLHVEPARALADLVLRGDAPLASSAALLLGHLGYDPIFPRRPG